MTIEQFAALYVTYIEPVLKAFLLFMIVMLVVYVVRFIKDPQKQLDATTQFFQFCNRALVAVVVGLFTFIVWICKFFWRVIMIVFSTLRDFFVSRI